MRKHNLDIGGYILAAGGRGTETPVLLLDTPPPLYIWRNYYKAPHSTLITLTNNRFLSQHIR